MSLFRTLGATEVIASRGKIGDKAFHLSVMRNAGVLVPMGVVIDSSHLSIERSDLEKAVADVLSTFESEFVMVRSSAVGEDGALHSFAGQLDSFQTRNDPMEVTDAIHSCARSLENTRLKVYEKRAAHYLGSMGIIIQEMIEPEYAGVLFTRSPSAPDKILCEYVEGHCEVLVSGEVTPESREFFREKIADQDEAFWPSLAKELKKIEKIYSTPQDVEWAYKDGKTYIVQSRPITTRDKFEIIWSNTNVNENYPNKLSPLLFSIARQGYYHYFKNLSFKLGVKPREELEYSYSSAIGLWGEKMYYNMTSIHSILAESPFKEFLSSSFDDFVGHTGKTSQIISTSKWWSRGKFVYHIFRHACILPFHVKRIERIVDRFIDIPIAEKEGKIFHQFLNIRFNDWYRASFADFYAMLSHGGLGLFLQWLGIKDSENKRNNLIKAIPGIISTRPVESMWRIKEEVLRSDAKNLFDLSPEETLQRLSDDPRYSQLSILIEQHLDLWGVRCSEELTFLSENYLENKASFIAALGAMVRMGGRSPGEIFRANLLSQEELTDSLIEQIRNRYGLMKGLLVSFLLKKLTKFCMFSISCRERVRFKQAQLYFKFKQATLKIGENLVSADVIQSRDDIFFLEYAEISQLAGGHFVDKEYFKDLIGLRRRRHGRAENHPDMFSTFPSKWDNYYLSEVDDAVTEDGILKGLPACGGTVKARAVVLESMHEVHKLRKGDILVTRQTDPGWICAFPLISGLVVERGGMLSHGAIVAREFGIPAVVGVPDATQVIASDSIVSLDGYKGTVECSS